QPPDRRKQPYIGPQRDEHVEKRLPLGASADVIAGPAAAHPWVDLIFDPVEIGRTHEDRGAGKHGSRLSWIGHPSWNNRRYCCFCFCAAGAGGCGALSATVIPSSASVISGVGTEGWAGRVWRVSGGWASASVIPSSASVIPGDEFAGFTCS